MGGRDEEIRRHRGRDGRDEVGKYDFESFIDFKGKKLFRVCKEKTGVRAGLKTSKKLGSTNSQEMAVSRKHDMT